MERKKTITPVLRILDVTRAREVYVDWPGFSIDREHRSEETFPLYFQVSKDGITLHLTGHYSDCIPGARIRIEIPGLAAFNQQLSEYRYYRPCVEKQEWGAFEMSLLDPPGKHIVFVEEPEQ